MEWLDWSVLLLFIISIVGGILLYLYLGVDCDKKILVGWFGVVIGVTFLWYFKSILTDESDEEHSVWSYALSAVIGGVFVTYGILEVGTGTFGC